MGNDVRLIALAALSLLATGSSIGGGVSGGASSPGNLPGAGSQSPANTSTPSTQAPTNSVDVVVAATAVMDANLEQGIASGGQASALPPSESAKDTQKLGAVVAQLAKLGQPVGKARADLVAAKSNATGSRLKTVEEALLRVDRAIASLRQIETAVRNLHTIGSRPDDKAKGAAWEKMRATALRTLASAVTSATTARAVLKSAIKTQ